MAYIDEGAGETFLCLHGQPTWSFLYRKMIPVFPGRVVVPDMFGFGRSDKPVDEEVYTFNFHRDSLLHLIRMLDLKDITLVVQDWGGLLGLTLPLDVSVKRLFVMNTAIAVGEKMDPAFYKWREYSNSVDLEIGKLCRQVTPGMTEEEARGYDAPFPSKEYKAGVRRFPNMVMDSKDMEGVEVSLRSMEMYRTKEFEVVMVCGVNDGAMGPVSMRKLAKLMGGWYTEIEAGHLVQEWDGVAERMVGVLEGRTEGFEWVEKSCELCDGWDVSANESRM